MWPIIIAIFFLTAAVCGGVAFVLFSRGAASWNAVTKTLRVELDSQRRRMLPTLFDMRELESLPPPVRRYFLAVLEPGVPMVVSAKVRHEGQFNTGKDKPKWMPFTSDQLVVTQRPGFDWNATVRMGLGLRIFVHDAYIAGEGLLKVSLMGLITAIDLGNTPELAQGELMRFLAEAAWYPTALLPSQGVRWEPIDDMSARATLSDGKTTVSLDFHFGADDLIKTVYTDRRYRDVGGKSLPTPWEGMFGNYEMRDRMRIPIEGEVAWCFPEGKQPYWRGRITEVEYQFPDESEN